MEKSMIVYMYQLPGYTEEGGVEELKKKIPTFQEAVISLQVYSFRFVVITGETPL